MSRSRVRRSFTVEVKSNGRQSLGLAIPSRVPAPTPVSSARALDAESLWLKAERVPEHVSPAPQAEARRVLPSLLVAEAPAPEPEMRTFEEPPLPRVRRVKPRTARSTMAEPATSGSPLPKAARVEPELLPAADASPLLLPTAAEPPAGRRRTVAKATPELARGERWKRRLPRACW
ncbi:hypothetical protein J2X36_004130 [Methylobacterium sp. BE186]|nr:hypothetical protein [Methylobacterium sp. BE186]